MRAATSMMLFSFRRRKQAEDAGERSDKRMLTPVLDSIHGAHLDGGAIVLWKGIGGGSYPAREVGPWIYDETGSGMFRLVYQPTTTIGAPTGPPVATTNEVSRSVALSVIRSQDLSGMLSVYTPEEDDAVEIMRGMLGYEPLHFDFSCGYLNANIRNLRRRTWVGDEGLTGPMCLFGEYLGDGDSIDLPENAEMKMDFGLGFHKHPERDAVVLARDLGGIEFGLVEPDRDEVSKVRPGSFRVLMELSRIQFLEDSAAPVAMSDIDVPRETALAICADRIRGGGLGVYTPERDDALELIREANRGKRPTETADVPELNGMSCFCRKDYDGSRPRAAYGIPPEKEVVSGDD